jgi:hypothetical protein
LVAICKDLKIARRAGLFLQNLVFKDCSPSPDSHVNTGGTKSAKK